MTQPTEIVFRRLDASRPTEVRLAPDTASCASLAATFGLRALRKFTLTGALVPDGRVWRLEARLGATIVQDCVVTLTPVTTRIDTDILRVWQPKARISDEVAETGAEVEMDPDTDAEPLPASIRLDEIAAESLALEIPDFPRAAGVELGSTVVGPPGAEPLTDEAANPFAVLSKLRDKQG